MTTYQIDLGLPGEILVYKDDVPVTISFEDFAHFMEKRPEILRDLHTEAVQKVHDKIQAEQTSQGCASITKPDLVSSYMMDLIEDNSRSDADPGL